MQKGANGAINRELGVLTRMFRLAVENGRVTRVPVVRKLKEAAPRHGSFEREQFEAIRKHLPVDLRAVVTVAYTFGWRTQSEVLTLKRSPARRSPGMGRARSSTVTTSSALRT